MKDYRGRGLGSELLAKALERSKKIGVVKYYRKLNGRYFDCVEMELFL